MIIRESGMPAQAYWETLFDVPSILDAFGFEDALEVGDSRDLIAGRVAGVHAHEGLKMAHRFLVDRGEIDRRGGLGGRAAREEQKCAECKGKERAHGWERGDAVSGVESGGAVRAGICANSAPR